MIAVLDTTADGIGDFGASGVPNHPAVYPGAVHNRGANVLFCDGHVQWYLQKDVMCTENLFVQSELPIGRMWNYDNRSHYE
jgi:prepilin-type processing-associated H-X9-DG protein